MRKLRYTLHATLCTLFAIALLTGCQAPDDDIYILYDNDAHCAVEGYEKMAALRADYLQKSIYVNVVSCGDFVQGSKVGSISKGRYPIAMMNAVPYDYVTLGNHEFDYGISQLKRLMFLLHAKCLCCNFSVSATGKQMFAAYDVRTYGTTKVAFVGVATPTTLSSSAPTTFQDKQGNWIYDFHPEDAIQLVQQAVNAARADGAEHVIVLSHLGDDTKGVNSVQLIQQTTGIDAVLDGHQHHVLNMWVPDAAGDSVLLASTGSSFGYIGCLCIDMKHHLSNQLIDVPSYRGINYRVHARLETILQKVRAKTDRYIGFSQVRLSDSDSYDQRLVRLQETNLGNFVADAMRVVTGSDIGVANGGGLRSSLPAGNVTYGDLLQVMPFNNYTYQIQITGAQLLDALEIGVDDYPLESGDLLQVSGMRYTFDPSIPTSVHLDEMGVCDSIGATRRIISAEIARNGQWEPIDPQAVYTLGGQSYNLVCGGSSGMFLGTKVMPTEHLLDVDAVSRYIKMCGDTIRADEYAGTQNRITHVETNNE